MEQINYPTSYDDDDDDDDDNDGGGGGVNTLGFNQQSRDKCNEMDISGFIMGIWWLMEHMLMT